MSRARSGKKTKRVTPVRPAVSQQRVRCLASVFVIVIAIFGYRLADLQLTPDAALAQPIGPRFRTAELDAPRGQILDRYGRSFALSLPAPSVVVDPRLVPVGQIPAMVQALSGLLTTDPATLRDRLGRDSAFAYLERQVDPEVGKAVMELGLPGIRLEDEDRREHPNGECSGLGVVGRVDIDQVGISGVELVYDDVLTGREGRRQAETSADGSATIPGGLLEVEEAQPGSDLSLTLERNLQYKSEQILAEAVEYWTADQGLALVMIPSTAEIIAAAGVGRDKETGLAACTTTNLTSTWTYEPGSIIKPLTIAGVLDAALTTPFEEIALPDVIEKVADEGEIKTYRDYFEHAQDTYTPTEIMSKSSNVGTMTLAERLGPQKLFDVLEDFGLGRPSSLGLPGEASGILDPLDENTLRLTNVSIGQGVAVTPLQMLGAYNTLASGGLSVPPVVVAAEVGVATPTRVVSEQTADQVMAMMREVVDNGTGSRAAVEGYHVAGKTGTAWEPCDNNGYWCLDETRYYATSFAGLIGNDLGPQVSILVILDNPHNPDPTKGVGGGSVAAPIFAEIAEEAVRQLRIPPATSGDQRDRVRAAPAVALP